MRLSIFWCLFLGILLNTTPVPIFGESLSPQNSKNELYSEPPVTPEAQTRQFYTEFFNMLLTLGIVVLLLLIITWAFKRLLHSRMHQINITSAIKILESRGISTKLSIHLIEVQGRGIVFAESSSGIEKLAEISLSQDTFQNILDEKMKK